MAGSPRNVLFVAGRLGGWLDAWRLPALLRATKELGHTVQVLCQAAEGVLEPGPGLVECAGLGSRWQRGWAVRRLVKDAEPVRPDVLHVLHAEVCDVGLALAERWQIPYLVTVDEFLPPGGRLRLALRYCAGVLATNDELADDLVGGLGLPESLVQVVPSGRPRPELEPSVPLPGQVPVVGCAGPMIVGSGLATFLHAARAVVDTGIDAEFVLAGEGPGEPEMRRLAERLEIAGRVTFAEPPGPASTFWKVLDVFCLTSLVPTTGNLLAQALAHGVPSICYDVAGLRSWLPDDVIAPRIPPADTAVLAESIAALLQDSPSARALGQRARGWITQAFPIETEAQTLAAVYQQACAQPAARPARAAAVAP